MFTPSHLFPFCEHCKDRHCCGAWDWNEKTLAQVHILFLLAIWPFRLWSFQSRKPSGGPDYLFRLEKMSWAGSYITSPALCGLIFPTPPLGPLKPFGNAQWSVSCSSVRAWHSFSQLSPMLSPVCDNSRLGLVSRHQDGYTRDGGCV